MHGIIIAEELQALVAEAPFPDREVAWVASSQETPAGSYHAIVPLLSRPIGARELDGLPNLRVIANCAVGVDNIDLDAAAARGVVVTNTPDVLTEATADLTWALILAATRRLKEGQQLLSDGGWTGWHPTQLLGLELRGATLGIIGAGRIGQAVGRRAVPFGLRVCYTARAPKPAFETETGAAQVPLDRLLAESDIVSVHVPATPETRGMFEARCFDRMKVGAYFVNTSRGDLVDEAALADAMARGHLAGAALDVFAREPAVPQALATHPRVVTLPHLGSATERTRRAMARLAVRNARAVLAGEPPVTPVRR